MADIETLIPLMAGVLMTIASLAILSAVTEDAVPRSSTSPGSQNSGGFDDIVLNIETVCREGSDSVSGSIALSSGSSVEFNNQEVVLTGSSGGEVSEEVGCGVDSSGITRFSPSNDDEIFDYTITSTTDSESNVLYKVNE